MSHMGRRWPNEGIKTEWPKSGEKRTVELAMVNGQNAANKSHSRLTAMWR